MDTNKLGLKIVHIQTGTNELLELNGSPEWTSKVLDIRNDLANLRNITAGSYVQAIMALEVGSLIAVAKPIMSSDRWKDCLVAWIYVPYDLTISGYELNKVVEFTASQLMQVKLDREALQQFFSKAYPTSPVHGVYRNSEDKQVLAYRYFGKGTQFTLAELFDKLNQEYYRKYKFVLLLDKAAGVTASEGENLTDSPLYDIVLMSPPKETSGFGPYLDDKPFVMPVFVRSDEKIKIVFKKTGYKDIEKMVAVNDKLAITPHDMLREVNFEDIHVYDEATRTRITGFRMLVNGKPLRPTSSVYLSDSERDNVQIKIDASGYEICEVTKNLNHEVRIGLKKIMHKYTFQCTLRDGKPGKFVLETQSELSGVPFKGYVSDDAVLEGRVNKLKFKSSKGGSKNGWILLLIGLLVGGLLGWGIPCLIGNLTGNDAVAHSVPEPSGKSQDTDDETSDSGPQIDMTKVLEYLEEDMWMRTDMETVPGLEGLYDAINKMDIGKILSKKEDFAGSQNYTAIVKIIEAAKNKEVQLGGTYSGDGSITVTKYIEYVRSKINPSASQDKQHENQQAEGYQAARNLFK